MTAACRCWCGCERKDDELDNATSADLTCLPCLLDRHRKESVTVSVPLAALERLYEGIATERDRRELAAKMVRGGRP